MNFHRSYLLNLFVTSLLDVELQLTAKLPIGQPGVCAVRHAMVEQEVGPGMSSRNQSTEEGRVQM